MQQVLDTMRKPIMRTLSHACVLVNKYLVYPIDRCYRAIIRIFRYLPVIIDDVPYDYSGIFRLISKKLELQIEYTQALVDNHSPWQHTTIEIDLRRMRVCKALCDRINDRPDNPEIYTLHRQIEKKIIGCAKHADPKDHWVKVFCRECDHRPVKLDQKRLRYLYKIEDSCQKEELTALCGHLRKYSHRWWS